MRLSTVPDETRLPPDSESDAGGADTAGVFAAVIEVYREQGYEQGYQKAMRDVLASLVKVSEQYLRALDEDSSDARRIVYRYVQYLEDQIQATSNDAGYVSGGLGI